MCIVRVADHLCLCRVVWARLVWPRFWIECLAWRVRCWCGYVYKFLSSSFVVLLPYICFGVCWLPDNSLFAGVVFIGFMFVTFYSAAQIMFRLELFRTTKDWNLIVNNSMTSKSWSSCFNTVVANRRLFVFMWKSNRASHLILLPAKLIPIWGSMLRVETEFIQSDLRFSHWNSRGVYGITTEGHSAQ